MTLFSLFITLLLFRSGFAQLGPSEDTVSPGSGSPPAGATTGAPDQGLDNAAGEVADAPGIPAAAGPEADAGADAPSNAPAQATAPQKAPSAANATGTVSPEGNSHTMNKKPIGTHFVEPGVPYAPITIEEPSRNEELAFVISTFGTVPYNHSIEYVSWILVGS